MNRWRPDEIGGPGEFDRGMPGGMPAGSSPAPGSYGGSNRREQPPRRGEIPIQVPDHTLLRIVGRGAYGEVWLARSALGTLRAVKVIRLDDFPDPKPFEREFRGIQKCEPISRGHDGLIDILQVGHNQAEGYFYYVMELADPTPKAAGQSPTGLPPSEARGSCEAGSSTSSSMPPQPPSESGLLEPGYEPRTLRHEIKTRGRLPVAECLWLGWTVASAVEHLHSAGLVHRDIKPSNLVFVGGLLKLADIGLIADIGDARSMVGTEGYLPPEGAGTPEADVYSLGNVLYEMSTGLDRRRFPELPQEMGDPLEAIPLREINEIVLKACARDPARRYPTATALRLDLERLQRGQSILQRAQRLHPEAVWPYFWFAQLHAAQGTYEHALEAINRYERASQVPMLTALRGYVFARMGHPTKARQVIDDLSALQRSLPYIPSYCVARIHAALGDREKALALEWLEKAESEGSEFLVFADVGGLRTDPAWDDLQEDPRFKALLRKVGLEQWPVPIHPLP